MNLQMCSQLHWIPRKKYIYIAKSSLMPKHYFPRSIIFVINGSMSSFWYNHTSFNYWIIPSTLPTSFQIVIFFVKNENNFLNTRALIFTVAIFFFHSNIFPLSMNITVGNRLKPGSKNMVFFRLTSPYGKNLPKI